jgi:hypothetical protein
MVFAMTMLAAESDGPGAAFTLRLSATKTVLSLCKASNVQHLSKIVLCLCECVAKQSGLLHC